MHGNTHTRAFNVVSGSRTPFSGRMPELRPPRKGRNEPGKEDVEKRVASRRNKELFLKILAVWLLVPSPMLHFDEQRSEGKNILSGALRIQVSPLPVRWGWAQQ